MPKLWSVLKKRGVNIDGELIQILYLSETTVVPLAELTEDQKMVGEGTVGTVHIMQVWLHVMNSSKKRRF